MLIPKEVIQFIDPYTVRLGWSGKTTKSYKYYVY